MTVNNKHEQNSQTLRLAIAIERHCGQLYQEWAHRFRPYDIGISIVLEELAKEEREHERELISIYEAVTDEKAPTELPAPVDLQKFVQGLQSIQDHFFVINPVMAKTILEMALQIEQFSHNFYQQYLKEVDNFQVSALIHRMIEFEDNHVRILTERVALT